MGCRADDAEPRERLDPAAPPGDRRNRGLDEGGSAHRGLHRLLIADQVVLADLALPEVLERIVTAGRELTGARCGALGIIGPGGLNPFVHSGLDEQTVARITRLPEGRGLLGASINDPDPVRVNKIADDPRSVGFPPGHPVMSSFLSVPIRVRGEVYGILYLTEPAGGEFTSADEELVSSLAVTSAIAIENAQLYDEAQHRQEWLHASAEVTRELLSNEGEVPLRLISQHAQRLADADIATVLLPTADRQALKVAVASGEGVDGLESRTFPMHDSIAGRVVDTAQPILIDEGNDTGHTRCLLMAEQMPIGPVMVLPLRGSKGVRGALTVGRVRGRPRFTEADLEMADVFANHAAVALELADARDEQQRMLLLEDRDMLAWDLHDHVVQRLFAAGLTLQSISAGMHDGEAPQRLARVVTEFDDTIRQIRTSIFALGGLRPQTSTVRARLLAVVGEISPLLGFEPEVHFAGPLDMAVPNPVVDDLVAVLREALTNTARHARASTVGIEVIATESELTMRVIDDGVGIGVTKRRSGLANLGQRAARHGGELVLSQTPPARARPGRVGTEVRFSVPL